MDKIYAERTAFCREHQLICVDPPTPSARFNEKDYEVGQEAEYHTFHLTREQSARLEQRYQRRWQTTLTIIKELSDECKRGGCKLVVIGFPPQLLKEGFGNAFTQIKSLANNEQFLAANFTKDFDQLVLAKKCEPRYITHLTPAGHEVMTELLINFLNKENLLPPKN
jgi:hypothetical protein